MKKCPQCQTDIPTGAKKCPNCQSDLRSWFERHPISSVILGLLVVGMIVNAIMPSSSVPNSNEQVTKNREIISTVFAKEVIKGILKSPSTAKFVDVMAYELSNEKDVWAVNGYVDSQNSFGAMIRSQWEVQLDYRDGKDGTVISILFDGKKMQ